MTANWHRIAIGAALLLALSAAGRAQKSDRGTAQWPQFRGPNARGVADEASLPGKWNVAKNENVAFKTPIPGLGHSSPVVWGDRVFVTSAVSGKQDPELVVGLYGNIKPAEDDTTHQWRIYCVNRTDGKVIWERTAHEGVPAVKRHTKATHANSTPATDGKHIVAFFGSEGLFCYDFDGNLRWKKSFGLLDSGYFRVPEAQWGFGSSPIIHENRVIVQCDVQGESFIAALNIADGKEIWRTLREEVPTWSTPTIYEHGGATRIAVNGYKHIGGYDATTGKEIWNMSGGGDIPVPTPVIAHDLIFITNAHGGPSPVYAVRTSARGDISLAQSASSNEHVAWSIDRGGAYMQTPLVYGDYLYVCRDNGILTCFNAKTGDVMYRERLGDGRTGFTASPVAGNGKVYFTSEEGDVYVIPTGEEFSLLSVNPLGEVCISTPAISGGTLYFRTKDHLVGIK